MQCVYDFGLFLFVNRVTTDSCINQRGNYSLRALQKLGNKIIQEHIFAYVCPFRLFV